jgi:hypothetical protein
VVTGGHRRAGEPIVCSINRGSAGGCPQLTNARPPLMAAAGAPAEWDGSLVLTRVAAAPMCRPGARIDAAMLNASSISPVPSTARALRGA